MGAARLAVIALSAALCWGVAVLDPVLLGEARAALLLVMAGTAVFACSVLWSAGAVIREGLPLDVRELEKLSFRIEALEDRVIWATTVCVVSGLLEDFVLLRFEATGQNPRDALFAGALLGICLSYIPVALSWKGQLVRLVVWTNERQTAREAASAVP
jgi:hypothetical protein